MIRSRRKVGCSIDRSSRSISPNSSKNPELRAQLYALFTPYGKVLDVVAQKGAKKRGQAFIVFRDMAGATSAMRSLDGEVFYDKKMVRPPLLAYVSSSRFDTNASLCIAHSSSSQQIEYAKSPSHATLKQQDPTFISPKLNLALNAAKKTAKVTVSHAENDQRKRTRPEDVEMEDGASPEGKKQRADDGDDMDMDDDEDEAPKSTSKERKTWLIV